MRSLKFFIGLLVAMLFLSCSNGTSLQKYYVDSMEKQGFNAVDLPMSFVDFSQIEDLSPEQRKAYESVKKLNILAFLVKDDNKEEYELEKQKIFDILKDEKYHELMRAGSGSTKTVVKYLGEEDAIDEVILFGTDKQFGFALVRVLGENMNPENIGEFMRVINNNINNADVDGEGINQLMNNFFGR
ncbi:DUF4252 domain-containing protein [Leptobacterium flavescens]|uniref:DUF4252 domain-containing protein n=1 Tax=Leptobacterium flavescens TaxID=472055 RepID=A0A6P0UFC0_9FLAO|nr:DUF4252 domain-containing protein [Leptobacterium flavescens]NER11971.1 DUF4252 domain-containing protein [Leptobacterium flavescens]